MQPTLATEYNALAPEYPASNAPFAQPQHTTQQVVHLHPNEYNSSLCDCCQDMGVCLDGCLCVPCEVGFQKNKLQNNRTDMHVGTCLGLMIVDAFLSCASTVAVSALTGAFHPVYWTNFTATLYNGLHLRPMINKKYGIEESLCASMCKSVCCLGCALCQQKREMRYRLDFPGGFFSQPPHPAYAMGPEPVYAPNSYGAATPGIAVGTPYPAQQRLYPEGAEHASLPEKHIN